MDGGGCRATFVCIDRSCWLRFCCFRAAWSGSYWGRKVGGCALGCRRVFGSRGKAGLRRRRRRHAATAAGIIMAAPGLGLFLCLVATAASGGSQSQPGAPSSSSSSSTTLRVCGDGCCAGSVRAGSAVAALCASRSGAVLQGRCCLDAEPARGAVAVAGLDLGNCSLHQLCLGFREASAAVIVDLTDNPLLEPLPEEAFQGFTQLQMLALPEDLQCPGGSWAWSDIAVREHSRICQGPRNPCNGSGALAWLCPEDSLCVPGGPARPQCLCADPYHGYKCLRQGSFPYLLFCGTLGAVTAALSVLFWLTQRRKAKSS